MTEQGDFDRDDWELVFRQLAPDATPAEYEEMWEDFVKARAEYLRSKELH